jgi:hypothetical protein
MIDEIIDSGNISSITLYGKYTIPAWTLIQYCRGTISNSMKLTSILNMYKLLINGKTSNDFAVEFTSKDLYPIIGDKELSNKLFTEKYFRDIDFLENKLMKIGKENSSHDFWYLIKHLERPNVLVKDNSGWPPIYKQENRTAIVLKNVIVESPPLVTFEGLGESINDLRFGKDREIRARINWENQQIRNAAENIEAIAKSSKILNDPNVPDGIKAYGNELYNFLMKKQSALNETIGIERVEIDIKA